MKNHRIPALEPLEDRIAPATLIVNSLADDGPGTLRQAIIDANAGAGADDIVFQKPDGSPLKGTIKLASSLPAIIDDLTIAGPVAGSAKGITIDGLKSHSIFEVQNADLSISDATIKNGRNDLGGAIQFVASGEILSLSNVVLTGNTAATAPMVIAKGGAIYASNGTVVISGSQIVKNLAQGGNGAGGMGAGAAYGGGILVTGASGFLTLQDTVVSGNVARGGNGEAGASGFAGSPGLGGYGGGIYFAAGAGGSLDNATITKNSARGGNGGAGGSGEAGGGGAYGNGGGIYCFNSGLITITQSTISANLAQSGNGGKSGAGGPGGGASVNSWGGGISLAGSGSANIDIVNSLITGNKAIVGKSLDGSSPYSQGGGVSIKSSSINISNSTISANSADTGGGIHTTASLSVENSTVAKNKAGFGGGLYVTSGTTSLENVTISSNSAKTNGGGVFQVSGTLDVYNSTVTKGKAGSTGGGIFLSGSPTANLISSIIADNKAKTDSDLSGSFNADFNLVGVVSTGTSLTGSNNIVNIKPQLGPLKLNGGPTATHAPKPTSPAIDTGNNPLSFPFDQRGSGFPRTVGLGTDIGAFEVQ